jgi:hypothetical protein
MAVTKSGQNNLTSPDGNGLALFVDINDGGLKMKDINGNIENVGTYVFNRPLDAGVLMMDNGLALSSTLAVVQDQNNSDSRLYLATNQVTAGKVITNTALGVDALLGITTGGQNTAIGYNALKAATEEFGNIAIGSGAMSLSYGEDTYNTAIGYNALTPTQNLDTNNYGIAIGSYAMNESYQYHSVAVGTNAMRNTGWNGESGARNNYNVAIGENAFRDNLQVTESIGIGKDVGYYEGTYKNINTSILLGKSVFGGDIAGAYSGNNIMIGNEVGYNGVTIGSTIAMGYQAMYQNYYSIQDIAIGYQAMYGVASAGDGTTSTDGNIAIGYQALYNSSSDELNIGISSGNIAIGYQALYGTGAIARAYVIAIGYQSALSPIAEDPVNHLASPIVIGNNAGTYAPSNSIFVGSEAGGNAQGITNIGVGYRALKQATGTENVAFGSNALPVLTTGNQSTAFGTNALLSATTSTQNTAVGYSALSGVTTGAGLNVGVGSQVATALTTGIQNVYVGALATASDVSNYNVVIGASAIGTGSNNTLVGQGASTGGFSGSIILGKGATATGNNQFVVGSTGTPVGTLATEAVVSDRSWSVIINGTAYKVLLKA